MAAKEEKAVVFRYGGRFGHFLRAEASVSALSYPIPPRTALLGMIGAVLGLEKDTPQVELADALISISGPIPRTHWHRVKLRKDPPTPLPRSVKKGAKGTSAPEKATLIRQEWLFNPSYSVTACLPSGYHEDLVSRLREEHWHYSPCLGLSEMPARLEYVEEAAASLNQAAHYMDAAKRMVLARLFVRGGLANMEKVLQYYGRRNADLVAPLAALALKRAAIEVPATPEELMALEGGSRELYYNTWDDILKGEDFKFEKRTRRPPANRINALVSFGNSLMYVTVLSEIHRTHLDPRIGYLHTTNQRRYTLNLDVAEIFKPIIVDRVIFTLVNRGVLKAKDFREDTEGVFLTEKGRKAFLEAYEARLKETVQHPKLGRAVSYRRLIRLELYKLEKHLLGDEPYEPFVSRW